ncbi:ATP-binding cassette domain-containing protein [Ascidiimonas aurantiaca]|uniref:ATP-binding cassette domain-containing protein n=1 Tax=Ascidiimonas aurantiaca TaxID=1685432 RepID=UPI0030EF3CE7
MIELTLKKKLFSAKGSMDLYMELFVKKGELVTFFGESGAGKTSVLRMLAGLMTPDEGYIAVNERTFFDSKRNINLPPQKRDIGYVFQDFALFPHLTVKQNLLYARDRDTSASIVQELLEVMGLTGLQHKKPSVLSGGQQQRVALARALVRKPSVLMLDEPLSSLHEEMRYKLREYLLQLHQELSLTLLLVSHDIGDVVSLSNKVLVLEEGKVVKSGDPLEVFSNTRISGKFQFTGKILAIEKEDIVFVITILVGKDLVRAVVPEAEALALAPGDTVLAASKAFSPILKKI